MCVINRTQFGTRTGTWYQVLVTGKVSSYGLEKNNFTGKFFYTPLIATVRWNKSPPPPLPIMSSSSEDGDASDANQFGMMM